MLGLMPSVYILECSDGSYYVGSTRTLARRVDAHMMGLGAAYTRSRLPVRLLWHEEFENIAEAFWWEKRIQNWSRAKREALMRGDYTALRRAAKKRFEPRAPVDEAE
ncbi:hypothetical protein C5D34_00425 [Rathayibacter sp. AY1B1]|jgi:putative endonuclease|nr:hypothetical protein C5D08_12065 [Rathayibacter sp. AY1B6]PPI27507.1 hypothetical protein C5D44_03705 [Rathayibacter sp. AY1B5]PPI39685.1 hypothetical protein C5D34_00425 [Rathayibacter sp. AY1B1]